MVTDAILTLTDIVAGYEAKLAVAETALAEAEVIRSENVKLIEKVNTIPVLEASIAMLTESSKLTAEKIDTAAAAKLVSMGHEKPLDTSGDNPTAPDNKSQDPTARALKNWSRK